MQGIDRNPISSCSL